MELAQYFDEFTERDWQTTTEGTVPLGELLEQRSYAHTPRSAAGNQNCSV
jgi:hypothetical protein